MNLFNNLNFGTRHPGLDPGSIFIHASSSQKSKRIPAFAGMTCAIETGMSRTGRVKMMGVITT